MTCYSWRYDIFGRVADLVKWLAIFPLSNFLSAGTKSKLSLVLQHPLSVWRELKLLRRPPNVPDIQQTKSLNAHVLMNMHLQGIGLLIYANNKDQFIVQSPITLNSKCGKLYEINAGNPLISTRDNFFIILRSFFIVFLFQKITNLYY